MSEAARRTSGTTTTIIVPHRIKKRIVEEHGPWPSRNRSSASTRAAFSASRRKRPSRRISRPPRTPRGEEHAGAYRQLNFPPTDAAPIVPADPSTWYLPPAQVFDNLYFLGREEHHRLGPRHVRRDHPVRRALRLLGAPGGGRGPALARPRPRRHQVRRGDARPPGPRRRRATHPRGLRRARHPLGGGLEPPGERRPHQTRAGPCRHRRPATHARRHHRHPLCDTRPHPGHPVDHLRREGRRRDPQGRAVGRHRLQLHALGGAVRALQRLRRPVRPDRRGRGGGRHPLQPHHLRPLAREDRRVGDPESRRSPSLRGRGRRRRGLPARHGGERRRRPGAFQVVAGAGGLRRRQRSRRARPDPVGPGERHGRSRCCACTRPPSATSPARASSTGGSPS